MELSKSKYEAIQAMNATNNDRIELALNLIQDDSWELRYYSVDLFASIGINAVPYLMKIKDHIHWWVRMNVARALGEIDSAEATEVLLKMIYDKHPTVRYYVLKSLGRLGNEECIDIIGKLTQDQEGYVRWRAAWALGEIGSTLSINWLTMALDDPYWRVRINAIEALCKIDIEIAQTHVRRLASKDITFSNNVAKILNKYQSI